MKLKKGHWYGWQMMPGYGGPYFSPIRLEEDCKSPKVGEKFTLRFLNANYARGVRSFELDLTLLFDSPSYLVASIDAPDGPPPRTAIISKMAVNWLSRCCPDIVEFLRLRETDKPDLNAALGFWYQEMTSSDYP